jgi:hypothetical protein
MVPMAPSRTRIRFFISCVIVVISFLTGINREARK